MMMEARSMLLDDEDERRKRRRQRARLAAWMRALGGESDLPPSGFDILTYNGQPVLYGNQRAMTQTLEIRYGR